MNTITYKGGPSIEEVRQRVKANTLYKLSSNENALGPSPLAVAAIQAASANLHIYPPRDDGRLRSALAEFHGRSLTSDHFVTAVGGVELLHLIARAFLQADDEVIICPPTFGWYVASSQQLGAKPVYVPLKADTFAHDIEGILTAVTPRTRLIYICNPNNPTGATVAAADMQRLLQNLPDHVIVIADEVYYHFVEAEDYPDSIQTVLDEQNVIIIHSFSKSYGLAGLRLGYAIAKPSLIQPIRQQSRPYHQPLLATEGGLAALKDKQHLQQTIELVATGKRYLYEQMTRLGIAYWSSAGNFVLIRPLADPDQFNEQLLERGIMIRPTSSNGLPGCFRVTIGLPAANQAFIAALEDILKGAS